MGMENLYRPGTRKGGKIWNFLGLGVLLLLMPFVFFLAGLTARNPGLIPAFLRRNVRGSDGLDMPQPHKVDSGAGLGRPPLWLGFLWGFAEGTLFFIVPDLIL